ncbi:hypothetical protein GCM10027456_77020 [Kineosporia babensis]
MKVLPIPNVSDTVSAAALAFTCGSVTATTLHWLSPEDVEADCAAATIVSKEPAGSGSGRKARTERCSSKP